MVATLPRLVQPKARRPFNPQSSELTYLVAELDEKFRAFEDLIQLSHTSHAAYTAAVELQSLLTENKLLLKRAGKYDQFIRQLITFAAIAGITLATVKGGVTLKPESPYVPSVKISQAPSIEQVQPSRVVNTPFTAPLPQRTTSPSEAGRALDSPIKSLAELKRLFAHSKAPGAIAIGAAEGNYDLKGNRQKNWYGHIDPGDGRLNKGFCSIAQGRNLDFNDGSPEDADAACLKMLYGKLSQVFSDFEKAGAEFTLERAINSLDLYNQAAPDVSKRFPVRLVEYAKKSSGVSLIADARAAAFYEGDRNTATGLLSICHRENRPVSDWQCVRGDQLRRAKAIRDVVNSLPAIAPLATPVQPESKNFFSGLKPITTWFSKPVPEQTYSAVAIIKLMERKGYEISRNPEEVNIVHVRNGIKADDQFGDWRIIIKFDTTGKPYMARQWKETTKPGLYIVKNTRRPDGAITVAAGQWEYQVGTHYGATGKHAHEALIQASPSKGFRDSDRDRTPETPVWGKFWTNIHAPWSDGEQVEDRSAGCLVTQTQKAHREFMEIVKSDRRYLQNPNYVFLSTIIDASEL